MPSRELLLAGKVARFMVGLAFKRSSVPDLFVVVE